AVFLLAINRRVYRQFEGYDWPTAWLHRLTAFQKERWKTLESEDSNLTAEYAELGTNFPAEKLKRLNELRRRRLTDYPPALDLILPTSFGNRLRAFEAYPLTMYGADSIALWLRLQTVLPQPMQQMIGAAQSSVNFFLNLSALSGILSAGAISAWLVAAQNVTEIGKAPSSPEYLLLFVLYGLASIVMYLMAVEQVPEWGETVKTAFDCYLPDLAERLGRPLPRSSSERRLFWNQVSQSVLYQVLFDKQQGATPPTVLPNKEFAK
ncbi:MAG TPA: hypothetical protein VGI19_08785, partial [Candidatus Cybelea sp.]